MLGDSRDLRAVRELRHTQPCFRIAELGRLAVAVHGARASGLANAADRAHPRATGGCGVELRAWAAVIGEAALSVTGIAHAAPANDGRIRVQAGARAVGETASVDRRVTNCAAADCFCDRI